MSQTASKVVALSGGIGGAKLALGLLGVLDPEELAIIANTGDDFEHVDLTICPDIDTLLYTLAGVSNAETGWGRADETWRFMDVLRAEDPEQAWFQLGDKDLETHRLRTRELGRGKTLTEVTSELLRPITEQCGGYLIGELLVGFNPCVSGLRAQEQYPPLPSQITLAGSSSAPRRAPRLDV